MHVRYQPFDVRISLRERVFTAMQPVIDIPTRGERRTIAELIDDSARFFARASETRTLVFKGQCHVRTFRNWNDRGESLGD